MTSIRQRKKVSEDLLKTNPVEPISTEPKVEELQPLSKEVKEDAPEISNVDPLEKITKDKSVQIKKNRKIFAAILEFVEELWEVYGDKKVISPLCLYYRIIQKIAVSDNDKIVEVLEGFVEFFRVYGKFVLENKLGNLGVGVVISYHKSSKIALEIQKYIYKSKNDQGQTEIIRQHLLAINALLEPEKKILAQELEKSIEVSNSKEMQFIAGIMDEAKITMDNIDPSNPITMATSFYQSGMVSKLMEGLNKGVNNGDMDPNKLMSSMQIALQNVMSADNTPSPAEPPKKVPEEKSPKKVSEEKSDGVVSN